MYKMAALVLVPSFCVSVTNGFTLTSCEFPSRWTAYLNLFVSLNRVWWVQCQFWNGIYWYFDDVFKPYWDYYFGHYVLTSSQYDHWLILRHLSWNCRLVHWPKPHQCPEDQQDLYLKLWRHFKCNSSWLLRTRKQWKSLSSSLSQCLLLSFPLWLLSCHMQSKSSPKLWRSYDKRTMPKTSGFASRSGMWINYKYVWMILNNMDAETPTRSSDYLGQLKAQLMKTFTGGQRWGELQLSDCPRGNTSVSSTASVGSLRRNSQNQHSKTPRRFNYYQHIL